ncbi:hypothetical protein CRUP_002636, partial [Coryphaenoides rupestris]
NHDTGGKALARRHFITTDGYPISGFNVDAVDQVVLNLQDEVQQTWRPGDQIVVASTDYSMHQAEEFTLLPCPHCSSRQVRIQGEERLVYATLSLHANILVYGEVENSCYGNNWCQFYGHDTYGGHIKMEVERVAPHQRLLAHVPQLHALMGRYPLHFHLCGDVDQRGGYSQPTYVDGPLHPPLILPLHQHPRHQWPAGQSRSGTRWATTRLGHCFFLEDGIEQRNTLYHNLGLLTRPGTLLPTDRNDTLCTAIRDKVHPGYTPSPSTECNFRPSGIANPKNRPSISNAAAGSQALMGRYPLHFHLCGDVDQRGGYSQPTYVDGLSIHHSFSRCISIHATNGLLVSHVRDTVGYDTLGHCFFLEDGIEQRNTLYHNLGLLTRPGTLLPTDRNDTLCMAIRDKVHPGYTPSPSTECKFRPHRNADPSGPRVAAIIDTLISFKNNDLGAWIRGAAQISSLDCNRFADNGVGLSFASDGSYPKDEGSSQEVSQSLFVGESHNRGTNGGQNKYWGPGASDGKMRTLPRNSTFRGYVPTPERFSSAVGFNLKNTWQLTPRNNLSRLHFHPSVGLRAFFGRPGQWFEENDLDGDKNSIFQDVDGSATGYAGVFVGRADNFLIRHPSCANLSTWNAIACSGRYAQVYIQTQGAPGLTLSISRDEYPGAGLVLRGINSQGAPTQQYQPVLMMSKSYTLHWSALAPRELVLSLINFDRGDWVLVGLCYPSDTTFQIMADIYDRQGNSFDDITDYGTVTSLAELEKRPLDRKYFFDRGVGLLWLYLQARHGRDGHSYCSSRGCERVKVLATTTASSAQTSNCTARAYPKYARTPSAVVPMPPRTDASTAPCKDCGAKQPGFYMLCVDACSGKVTKKNHFPAMDARMQQFLKAVIPKRSIVLMATRGEPRGFANVSSHLVPLGVAKTADLHGKDGPGSGGAGPQGAVPAAGPRGVRLPPEDPPAPAQRRGAAEDGHRTALTNHEPLRRAPREAASALHEHIKNLHSCMHIITIITIIIIIIM